MQNYHLVHRRPSSAHFEYSAARLKMELTAASKETKGGQILDKKKDLDNGDQNKGSNAGNNHIELHIWAGWLAQRFTLVTLVA